jgi:hypothetical protein
MTMTLAGGVDRPALAMRSEYHQAARKAVDRDRAKRNHQHSDFPRFNAKTVTRPRCLHCGKRSARICKLRSIVARHFLTSPSSLSSVARYGLGIDQCTTTTPAPTGSRACP